MLKSPLSGATAVGSVAVVGAVLLTFTTSVLFPAFSSGVTSKRNALKTRAVRAKLDAVQPHISDDAGSINCNHWLAPLPE